MPIQAGDRIPSEILFEGTPDTKVNIAELCKDSAVIFGLPGAYTPTCSADHVPGFLKVADEIKMKGVQNIICVSVNDPFVMAAWGKSLDPAGNIRFLADTKAAFTTAIGLTVDLTAVLGNIRSKRYVLVAEKGKVKDIHVEPDGTGLTCSRGTDALNML